MKYRDYEPVDLQGAGFKRHQLEGFETDNIENAFAGFVLQVIGRINDGKEATVYLCRMEGDSPFDHAAAKIFRSRQFRHFDRDRGYRDFSKMRDRRRAKMMRGRGGKSDRAFHFEWVKTEWDILIRLRDLGIRVPEPIARYDDGVLMEYIGDDLGAAPRLIHCKLDRRDLETVASTLFSYVETMLENDIVHGDLSPYNILYDGREPIIIDVPQATDLRMTPGAYELAVRDLGNLDRYFGKHGVETAFGDLQRLL